MDKQLKQRGFTLFELIVVVAILGVLVTVAAPWVSGKEEPTVTLGMVDADTKIKSTWKMIASRCKVSTDVSKNVLNDTGKTPEDVLFGGLGNVKSDKQTCYKRSGAITLGDLGQSDGGVWKVNGMEYHLLNGASDIAGQFKCVSEEQALDAVNKFYPSVSTLLAAGNTTAGNKIFYSAATACGRDITIN